MVKASACPVRRRPYRGSWARDQRLLPFEQFDSNGSQAGCPFHSSRHIFSPTPLACLMTGVRASNAPLTHIKGAI